MAIPKPSKLPIWDINATNLVEPQSTNQSDGWQVDANGIPQKPPFQFHNYMWHTQYKWLEYLDAEKALIQGDSAKIFKVADAVNANEAVAFGQFTGYVLPFATSTVPNGFLECNGAVLSRTTYADLFTVLGTTYGAGDGTTTFNIPDLRGEFIRGFDNGRGVDSGRAIGTYQLDDGKYIESIRTSREGSLMDQTVTLNYNGNENIGISTGTDYSSSNRQWFIIGRASEIRPRNLAMMYCIKY